jgi:hypothetical protein
MTSENSPGAMTGLRVIDLTRPIARKSSPITAPT